MVSPPFPKGGTECMSGRVTRLRWQKLWLVTRVDEMLGGSRSLAVCQRQSWLSSMLSCKAVPLFIVAPLQISSLLRSAPLFVFTFLSFFWPVMMCCRAFWTCCGKVWGPDGGVEAGDFEAGKYIGYENINMFYPSLSPRLVELQSIRLQTDTSELVNHCRSRAVTRSFETHTTVQRYFWQDDGLKSKIYTLMIITTDYFHLYSFSVSTRHQTKTHQVHPVDSLLGPPSNGVYITNIINTVW